jgi:DNA polymerase III delta prime subunit
MWREILGLEKKPNNLVDLITPRRSFADVILPEGTRQQLYEALTQIEKHRLIFAQWGLGERHPTGLGLAFNFAGPPGTGKTICAEAIAFSLGRKLMRVRYAELESCWAGDTGKNIRAAFREARAQDAVLFFDEADSIAARRFSNIQMGYEREANQSVNILLKELEEHEGVVIFATNMASNFDPAFERRIRTHILFRIPGPDERELIWQVQIHPGKTPLGDDVDFRELAERYEASGGDIRNAVLKAAQIAAGEEGPDEAKTIRQRHFVAAMEQVLSAKRVMQQNLGDPYRESLPWQEAVDAAQERLRTLDDDLSACRTELEILAGDHASLSARLEERTGDLGERLAEVDRTARETGGRVDAAVEGVASLREEVARAAETQAEVLKRWEEGQSAVLEELRRRLEAQEAALARATLLPFSKTATAAGAVLLALAMAGLGLLGGRLLF